MADPIILGVHSWSGNSAGQGSSAEFVDGHSWLTITSGGRTVSYGLYPDDHGYVVDNGDKSDIRYNIEQSHGYKADANRYYELTPVEYQKLQQKLQENVEWAHTNTCASWASETATEITGETIDADDYGGFETPREMAESIKALERKTPSSLADPVAPSERHRSSLFGAAELEVPANYAGVHGQLDGLVGHEFNVRNVDWGNGGDNTVAACTVACVKQNITDVQYLTVANGNINMGQKNGYEWSVASVDAVQAARTPQQESFAQLAALDLQQSQKQDNPVQTQTKTQSGPSIG
jgi:hypothetical protein